MIDPILGTTARRFARATQAASAVEFAFIFPVLLVFMLAGIQLVIYINAVRKIELLAASMSEMLSEASPPSYTTTIATVSAADLHFAYDSGLVIFPYLMKDAASKNIPWWQDIYIDYAGIAFTPIQGSNCSSKPDQSTCYTANVVWTSSGTTGPNYRPCAIQQQPAPNTARPNRTTLPAGIFGPNSIVAVDVVYTFTPAFGAAFLPTLTIARSVFVKPRYATQINFSTSGNDGIAQSC